MAVAVNAICSPIASGRVHPVTTTDATVGADGDVGGAPGRSEPPPQEVARTAAASRQPRQCFTDYRPPDGSAGEYPPNAGEYVWSTPIRPLQSGPGQSQHLTPW